MAPFRVVVREFAALLVLAACALFSGVSCTSVTPPRARSGSATADSASSPPALTAAVEYTTIPTARGIRGGEEAEELAARVRAHFSGLSLVADGRLAALGEQCVAIVRERGKVPDSTELDALARRQGLVGPPVTFILVPRVGGDWANLEQSLATVPSNLRFTHLGVSLVRRYAGLLLQGVIILQAQHLSLASIPRNVTANAAVTFQGAVAQDYREPRWVWTRPDGSTRTVELVSGADLSYKTEPLVPGVHRFEVFGVGPTGLEVLANIPITAGSPPVTREAPEAPVDESDPARALLELVNRARARAGLRPLTRTPALDGIAEAHSADMVAARFFGHDSPTAGNTAQRIAASGVKLGRYGENVGRAESATMIHRMLMDSPGHRRIILTPEFTHLGLGIAVDRASTPPALCVTEEFGGFPEKLTDPVGFATALFDETNRLRATAKLPPLRREAALDARALDLATRFAAEPKRRADEFVRVVVGSDFAPFRWLPVRLLPLFPATPDQIEGAPNLVERDPALVGIGVAQTEATADSPSSNVAVFVLAP